jgi:hypothetical protein
MQCVDIAARVIGIGLPVQALAAATAPHSSFAIWLIRDDAIVVGLMGD